MNQSPNKVFKALSSYMASHEQPVAPPTCKSSMLPATLNLTPYMTAHDCMSSSLPPLTCRPTRQRGQPRLLPLNSPSCAPSEPPYMIAQEHPAVPDLPPGRATIWSSTPESRIPWMEVTISSNEGRSCGSCAQQLVMSLRSGSGHRAGIGSRSP